MAGECARTAVGEPFDPEPANAPPAGRTKAPDKPYPPIRRPIPRIRSESVLCDRDERSRHAAILRHQHIVGPARRSGVHHVGDRTAPPQRIPQRPRQEFPPRSAGRSGVSPAVRPGTTAPGFRDRAPTSPQPAKPRSPRAGPAPTRSKPPRICGIPRRHIPRSPAGPARPRRGTRGGYPSPAFQRARDLRIVRRRVALARAHTHPQQRRRGNPDRGVGSDHHAPYHGEGEIPDHLASQENRENSASSVVTEVMTVRDSVSLTDRLSRSAIGSCLYRRRFSRTRSNTTTVSLIE